MASVHVIDICIREMGRQLASVAASAYASDSSTLRSLHRAHMLREPWGMKRSEPYPYCKGVVGY